MFYFFLPVITNGISLCVNLFQLPHREQYVVGRHVVISVLRLAAAKLHAAVLSANPERASRARSTYPCCDDRESKKDNAQSVSSAVSRATSSSE